MARSIVELLKEKHVFTNLSAKDKNEILSILISSFSDEASAEELEAIRKAVYEREQIMSTGVGKGLAIPHGKSPELEKNYGAFAVLETPVNYESVDDQPVSLIFLLAGPSAGNRSHIKMLSRISRLLNNETFRNKLKKINSSEEILQLLKRREQSRFGV